MTEAPNVLVVAETQSDRATKTALEMVGLGRILAREMDGSVNAAVLAADPGDRGHVLIAGGADRVFAGCDPVFANGAVDPCVAVLEKLARDLKPTVILFGHTGFGAEAAPRLAFRLGAGIATDCIGAAWTGQRLLLTRPCLGGKACETVHCLTIPAVATFKPKSQPIPPSDSGRVGEIVAVDPVGTVDRRVTVIAREPRSQSGKSLQDADVVVAGGRGLKDKNGFELAQDLAAAFNGAIGATRVACDMGLCEYTNQIGASGVTVAPDLYIAVGVSGAGHHMVGCLSAKNIVAINIDPDAAIFSYARFGVVGDSRTVLPALRDEVLRIKNERRRD